eukprot:3937023-Rhodomonas_salina.1
MWSGARTGLWQAGHASARRCATCRSTTTDPASPRSKTFRCYHARSRCVVVGADIGGAAARWVMWYVTGTDRQFELRSVG